MTRARGFTLVEIMVVVLLIAVLAGAIAPLANGWIANAEFTSSSGVLRQAVGRAKSAALRNSFQSMDTVAAAAVCVSGNRIEVRERDASTASVHCGSSGGTLQWSSKIGTQLSLTSSGNPLSCWCFTNKGQFTTSPTGCSSCATSATVTFSGASFDNANLAIY